MKYLLRQRWWWISLIIILLVLAYFHRNIYQTLKKDQIDRTFEELHTKAELAEILVDVLPIDTTNQFNLQNLTHQIKQRIGVRVTFIDLNGIVIADSDVDETMLSRLDNHGSRPEILQAKKEGFGQSYRFSRTVKHNLFYVAVPIEQSAFFNGHLRLSYYSERVQAWITATRTIFFISFLSSSFVLWFIIGIILYQTTVSWHHITEIARSLKTEEVTEVPFQKLKGESLIVADAFKSMIKKINAYNQQLQEERHYLQETLNTLDDAIVVVNEKHLILLQNSQFRKRFGGKDQKIMGRNILEFFRVTEVVESFNRVVTEQKSEDFVIELSEGLEKQFFQCSIQPIDYYSGNLFLFVFHDITKIKKLEAIRRDFVANVSHEMKTPVTSMIGYMETLLDHPVIEPDQQKRYLTRSLIQAKKMQALVSDLLQLSELEQGRELNRSVFSVRDLIEEIVVNERPKADQKQQKIELLLSDRELSVWADRKQIGIVLENLLQNAFSYTPEKGRIKIFTEKNEPETVTVFVQDNGMGIDEKYFDRIFQRFYRVDLTRDIHKTGTGLGLAIVKHIVEQHGGKVGVQSAPGKGSTFWFTLLVGHEKK